MSGSGFYNPARMRAVAFLPPVIWCVMLFCKISLAFSPHLSCRLLHSWTQGKLKSEVHVIKRLRLEHQETGTRPWLVGDRRASVVPGSDSLKNTTPSADSCSEPDSGPDHRRAGWKWSGGNTNKKQPYQMRGWRCWV